MRALIVLGIVLASPLLALDEGEARHLLARTGFGPTPAAVAALVPLSREQAVDAILATATTVPTLVAPDWCADPFPTYVKARKADWDAAYAMAQGEPRKKREDELRKRDEDRGWDLKRWWWQELCATRSPLTERMVLFWHNHFTSQLSVVGDPRLMWEQNQLLRRHALGSFAYLALAIPFDPAMHRYLDSDSNVAAHPNENFAREVMELFTVGEGNYSEKDIKEAARAFTGYKLGESGVPELDGNQHDGGRKVVLGNRGVFDAKGIIEILLLREKNVALNVCTRLWREFVSETPDEKAVYTVSAAFYRARYQIPAALRALLASDAFWDPANRGELIKSPVELMVGAVRQLDQVVGDPIALVDAGKRLGQDLFDPPNVKGWKGGRAWISTHSLLARRDALEAVLSGKVTAASKHHLFTPRPMGTPAQPMVAALTTPTPWLPAATAAGDRALIVRMLLPRSGVDSGTDVRKAVADALRDPSFNLK